jgi:hypothetical protein
MITAAVLVWFLGCMAYLVQALVRESAAYARMKQRFAPGGKSAAT